MQRKRQLSSTIYYETELYHHGVKGMKWGVRRYQNKDGSLTALGRKHLGLDSTGKIDRRYLNDDGTLNDKGLQLAIKNEKKSKKPKSTFEKMWIKQYKKKGYSIEKAEELAKNKKRALIAASVIAGTTVAGLAALAIYKHGRKKTLENIEQNGTVIKAGTVLQRIKNDSSSTVNDQFYASHDKVDNLKYKGLYGLQKKMCGNQPYVMKLKVTNDLKIPSEKTAKDVYKELVNTDRDFDKMFGGYGGYEVFNTSLVLHDPGVREQTDKFYNKLKSMGYNALQDINDSRNSGYNAVNPVIVFDKNAVLEQTVKKLGNGEMLGGLAVHDMVENGYTRIARIGLLGTAAAGGISVIKEKKIAREKGTKNGRQKN